MPLDEEQVREVLSTFKEQGIEAVAVSFLWSIINDAHEKRVAELIKEARKQQSAAQATA